MEKKIEKKKFLKNKQTLSKGLEEIFGDNLKDVISNIEDDLSIKDVDLDSQILKVKLSKIIRNPYQPRIIFNPEKLQDLANSIKLHGLLTPIALKKTKGGKYYIIAGERRFKATKLAGFTEINAIVIDVDDRKMQELAIIENVQREDLNPIEEALTIKNYIFKYQVTHDDLASILGKSRVYVTNSLRLLKLDEVIINGILENRVSSSICKPLIGLEAKIALKFYNKILTENMNVRDVENLVRKYKKNINISDETLAPKARKSDVHLEYVTNLLSDKISSNVEITKSKIIIPYKGTDQLNRILKKIDVLKD